MRSWGIEECHNTNAEKGGRKELRPVNFNTEKGWRRQSKELFASGWMIQGDEQQSRKTESNKPT